MPHVDACRLRAARAIIALMQPADGCRVEALCPCSAATIAPMTVSPLAITALCRRGTSCVARRCGMVTSATAIDVSLSAQQLGRKALLCSPTMGLWSAHSAAAPPRMWINRNHEVTPSSATTVFFVPEAPLLVSRIARRLQSGVCEAAICKLNIDFSTPFC